MLKLRNRNYFCRFYSSKFPNNILFEDSQILAVNKACGQRSQSDSFAGDSLHDQLKHYIKDKYNKPGNVFLGLVHRLDKVSSGAIVFARTSKAARRLSEAFQSRTAYKEYNCVIHGSLSGSGILENWMVFDDGNPRICGPKVTGAVLARLQYEVIANITQPHAGIGDQTIHATVLRIKLDTGRKHQIRCQLSNIGHSIIGDSKYGGRNIAVRDAIMLHSRRLVIKHPTKEEKIEIEAPFPNWWDKYVPNSVVDRPR